MCGICGILKLQESDTELPAVIKNMNDSIKHRGPDDEGYVFFESKTNQHVCAGSSDTQFTAWNTDFEYRPRFTVDEIEKTTYLALGHRRLSVIDLSEAAHQPMCIADNDIWITLNGEIYNYIELRNELITKGYLFISQSDTEVLLYAYKEWGFDCLQKLNGMWSFVIFDRNKNILFGSRDRFGVKPLYYYSDSNLFAFASEQKALLQIPENNIGINESAIFDYLFLNQIELQEEGFFKNIFELKPAHYFIYNIDKQTFSTTKYYELAYQKELASFDASKQLEYQRNTRELIHNAIDLRLQSDIPVGFCLSGGIDSSSIVCMAAEIGKEKKHSQLGDQLITFTAINKSDEFNEAKWAELVAKKTGTEWIKANCTSDDLMNELEKIIYHQDIPLLSTSTYAQYKVMQTAANHGIHILIDGQGGDELFAGYAPFYSAYYSELFCKLKIKTLFSEIKNIVNSPTTLGIYAKSNIKYGIDKLFPKGLKKVMAKQIKVEARYLTADFIKNNKANISFAGEYQLIGTNRLLHKYVTESYLKNLLRWEDRCSMAFSVESRTPFSDDINLIEYIFSLPANYKIYKGWSKSLLRNAMQGILPDAIKNRTDKMGFSTPQQTWLKEINLEMKSRISALMHTDNYVDAHKLLNDWETIFEGNNSKAQDFAWRYMNYLIWKEMFFGEDGRRKTEAGRQSIPIFILI
jgi:asparagine synthase (glutamine-hydrolysing)